MLIYKQDNELNQTLATHQSANSPRFAPTEAAYLLHSKASCEFRKEGDSTDKDDIVLGLAIVK